MIVVNKFIPAKGFIAMAIFPFIFVRKENEDKFTPRSKRHELIHFQQQKELFVILFYIWYIVEFILRVFKYSSISKAYENICFEREAYSNQDNADYLTTRQWFNFFKYI